MASSKRTRGSVRARRRSIAAQHVAPVAAANGANGNGANGNGGSGGHAGRRRQGIVRVRAELLPQQTPQTPAQRQASAMLRRIVTALVDNDNPIGAVQGDPPVFP